jgi:hypothetical protein
MNSTARSIPQAPVFIGSAFRRNDVLVELIRPKPGSSFPD